MSDVEPQPPPPLPPSERAAKLAAARRVLARFITDPTDVPTVAGLVLNAIETHDPPDVQTIRDRARLFRDVYANAAERVAQLEADEAAERALADSLARIVAAADSPHVPANALDEWKKRRGQ